MKFFTRKWRTPVLATMLLLIVAGGAFAQMGKRKTPGSDICVAKSLINFEDANYTTIQAAVNAAKPGQVIEILDTEVYAEQVTIDGREASPWTGVTGGKNGITIRYVPAGGAGAAWNHPRPTIRYKDNTNTRPRTAAEAQLDNELTGAWNYETNGALRVLHAKDVTIEGIAVDGGGAFAFGAANVWGEGSSLNHGNAAVALAVTGGVTVRGCDLQNAFFGIYIKDRNTGGAFGNPNPADGDNTVPLSGFGNTGGHLFEYNRVNGNVVGFFFESAWDLGSTARNNLIYNNKKANIPAANWAWAGEGADQKNGGAFMFKDMYLTPIAIYNNTLYDNTGNFIGHWQVGGQHLIFNNIFGKSTPSQNAGGMSLDDKFPFRMNNNVSPDDVTLSLLLKSLDQTSENFLVPDWTNQVVNDNIKNKGWADAGIRNNDGSIADIGAIPSTGVRRTTVARITPTSEVLLNTAGNTATANFSLKFISGTINNPKIKLLRWIMPVPANTKNTDVPGYNGKDWPNEIEYIASASVRSVTPTSTTVKVGNNSNSFPISGTVSNFGFFEMIVEGTDANGNTVTSDVGFLPYRKLDYKLDIRIFAGDAANLTGAGLSEVKAGVAYKVVVIPQKSDGASVQTVINEVTYSLRSDPTAFMYDTPEDKPRVDDKNMPANGRTYTVYFARAGQETIMGAGVYESGSIRNVYVGTKDLVVKPGTPERVEFKDPISLTQLGIGQAPLINRGVERPVLVEVQDKFGNAVDVVVPVTIESNKPEIGDVGRFGNALGMKTVNTDAKTGVATFTAVVTNGKTGETFDMTATIADGKYKDKDNIGRLRLGRAMDRLDVFYADTEIEGNKVKQDLSLGISGNVTEWFKITVSVVVNDTINDKQTGKTVKVFPSEDGLVFSATSGGAAATEFPLNNGKATFWVSATAEVKDACVDVEAYTAAGALDGGIGPGNRCGINFAAPYNSISSHDREVPRAKQTGEFTAVAPVPPLTAEFAAGPNPVGALRATPVQFFRQGSRIKSAKILVYDASGNAVRKLIINDDAVIGNDSRRAVGSWDLTDKKGRRVPDGAYLVRGTITGRDGKRERVSAVMGVR